MNNEPVAWMETYKNEPNNLDWDKNNLNYGSEFHDVIPLYTHPVNPYQSITNTKIEPTVVSYTHPVKELTDEEIGDFEYQIIRACGLSTANSDINPIGLRQIIKAILKKAQEK